VLVVAPAGAQTSPDLKAAALSPGDLEPNWRVLFELPVNGESYTAVLGRRSREALGILLVNDPHYETSPAMMLDMGESGLSAGVRAASRTGGAAGPVTVQTVAPAMIGEEAVQASVSLTTATGEVLSGSILAWRQGPFVVTMYYLTDQSADLVPFAEQQRAKLATVLGAATQTAPPASMTNAGPGRTSCAAMFVALVTVTSVLGGATPGVTVQSPSRTVCIIRS
jgi:hypothetical protein